MRRPLLSAGIASFFAMAVASAVGLNACAVLAVFLLAAALVFALLRIEPCKIPAFLCAAAGLSFGLFALKTARYVLPAEALAGRTAAFEAWVTEPPEADSRGYRITAELLRTDCEIPLRIRVQIRCPADCEDLDYGDIVEGTARFYPIAKSYRGSYWSKGIYLTGYATQIRAAGKGKVSRLYNLALKIRRGTDDVTARYLPGEDGRLLTGLLIGTRLISSETAGHFRAAGLSHLLAVSGQQMAVLGGLCLTLLGRAGLSRRVAALATLPLIFFFAAVTGFPYSVVRAGLMYGLFLLGIVLSAESDTLNGLGFSVLVPVLLNPFAALDAGLRLSAAATLGLTVLPGPALRRAEARFPRLFGLRPVRTVSEIPLQTLSALVFTLPVSLAAFGEVSLAAPLANLAAWPAVIGILPLCAAALAADAAGLGFLAQPLFFLAGLICRYLRAVAAFFGRLPFATKTLSGGLALLILAACLIYAGLALALRRERFSFRRTAAVCLLFLLTGTLSYRILNRNVTTLRVFDLNSGFSVMISGSRQSVLVGTGGDAADGGRILRALSEKPRNKAEAVFIPVSAKEWYGGLPALAGHLNLVMVPADLPLSSHRPGDPKGDTPAPYADCTVTLWEGVTARLFSAESGGFLRFRLGQTAVLIAAPGADAALLPAEYRQADLLVVSESPPKNTHLLSCRRAVTAEEEEKSAGTFARLHALGMNPVLTGGYGDITIKTRGNRDLRLTRERS